ncbi:hypothetical protein [Streptosporangium sp. NPDC000239]|uniref:hypothetical protein n=1 Tax=unclassified Streptosporangium TaxID=2632669 RepID=UPI003327A898
MNSGRKMVTAYFTVFCGLLLAGLALFAPLPLWAWPALALLVAVAVLVVRAIVRPRDSGWPEPEPLVMPVIPVEREGLQEVVLPSCEPDYDFRFSATVRWRLVGPERDAPTFGNPGALAVKAILERARTVTEERRPERVSLVQHELNAVLGTMEPIIGGRLEAMAESVALTLSEQDQKRLDRLAVVRKKEAVWEHERRYERSRREYLGGDVLKDTGSAVVWWLAKNDDQVQKTVEDIELLARLTSAANNENLSQLFQHLASSPAGGGTAGDHFEGFLQAMGLPEGEPQRALFARHVIEVVSRHGRQDVADELERRFDTPATSAPDDPGSEPDPGDEEPGF